MDGSIADRLLKEVRGENPPKSPMELVDRLGAEKLRVFQTISRLLSAGKLERSELPWRRDKEARTRAGRPSKKASQRQLEGRLDAIIAEGNKDRVPAIRALMDLRSIGQEVTGPPPPNDEEGIANALTMQLRAVGTRLSQIAWERAFNCGHDILDSGLVSSEVKVVETCDVGSAPPG